jgi:plasmid stability protein
MAKRLVIENFPPDLERALKVKAAQEGTNVKALIIAAVEKLLGRKAGAK